MGTIEDRHFETASEFLAALRRSGPLWLHERGWEINWIFRGQPCANWSLTPTAWRSSAKQHVIYKKLEEAYGDSDVRQAGDLSQSLFIQQQFEYHVAQEFCRLVDELGLSIPGGMTLKPPVKHLAATDATEFPTEPIHPAYALAQHHGTPTRLLDWTHNPLIAAFFAADAVQLDDPGDSSGNIVVWALHRKDRATRAASNCQELTVPRSEIGFLHSQEALFTFVRGADLMYLINGNWPCLEELIPGDLRRLTLPKAMAPELRRLLWAERISKAHLMPTLDNVTKSLLGHWQQALPIGGP